MTLDSFSVKMRNIKQPLALLLMVGDEFSSKIIGVPRLTKNGLNTSSPCFCVIFVKILVSSLKLEQFVLKMLPNFMLQ